MRQTISDENSYNPLIRMCIWVGDILICAGLFYLFAMHDYDWNAGFYPFLQSLFLVTVSYLACTLSGNLIVQEYHARNYQIVLNVVRNVFIFAIFGTLILYVGRFFMPSWLHYIIFLAVLLVVLACFRLGVRKCVKIWRASPAHVHNVVLVGDGENMLALYEELRDPHVAGYNVVGYFDYSTDKALKDSDVTWLGDPSEVIGYLQEHKEIWGLFCSLPSARRDQIIPIINYCENNLLHFFSVPNVRSYVYNRMYMNTMGSVPYLSLHNEPLSRYENRAAKRLFDIFFSILFLLCVFWWVWIIVAIVIKITMPGPVFFLQRRTGLDGKEFIMYKFRSMKVNDHADTVQATEDDPRKTKWGNFLRRTSIDELPQFVNVLKGEMSVVGPRPHMISQTEEYSHLVDKYMVRHRVKPGITGWSQVTGCRGEIKKIDQLKARIKGDVYYVEHWSFWLDIYIIIRTTLKAFVGDPQAY